ncbi:MAG: hypothetical protein WD076_02820, partial [Parvularculaceae bacterium]
ALDSLPWLTAGRFPTMYCVGGAWRAMGRIHMMRRDYPVSVLHHYEFSRSDAIAVCDIVAKQTLRSLQTISGIPRRRVDTLPIAALVFKSVLERTGVKNVMISAGGIREGLLYRDLSAKERAIDPLFAGARFCAEMHSPEPRFGDAVVKLTAPLIAEETPAFRRIAVAACMLVDVGAYAQPDLRAQHAFDIAVREQLYGLSHAERVAIALALYVRHEGEAPAGKANEAMLALLDADDRRRALQLGLALRFAADLAPKAPGALDGCTLSRRADMLEFRAPKNRQALMSELPRKRLSALAAAFDSEPAEDYY